MNVAEQPKTTHSLTASLCHARPTQICGVIESFTGRLRRHLKGKRFFVRLDPGTHVRAEPEGIPILCYPSCGTNSPVGDPW